MSNSDSFSSSKSKILNDIYTGIDFSPKGTIDEPVREVVDFINNTPDLVTTSSCSGRISCYIDKKNKGVEWVLVKHRTIRTEEILTAVRAQNDLDALSSPPLIMLKCEPFILHVLCRDVESAANLHLLAMSCGYRESGIGIGNKKTMVAIRTTSFSLEFPMAVGTRLFLSDEDLAIVVRECNTRLTGNFNRIARLLASLKANYQWPCFLNGIQSGIVPEVHRYGHVSYLYSIGAQTNDTLVVNLGGVGENPGEKGHSRSMDAQLLKASGYCPFEDVSGEFKVTCGEEGEAVHSATSIIECGLTEEDEVPPLRRHRIALISGGRLSPTKPLPALQSARLMCSSAGGNELGRVLSFRQCGDVPADRWGHSLTRFDEVRLLLVGGRNTTAVFNDAYFLESIPEATALLLMGSDCVIHKSDKVEIYFKWTRIPSPSPLPTHPQVFFHACCSIGKRAVLLSGGLSSSALQSEFSFEQFPVEQEDTENIDAWILTEHDATISYRTTPLTSNVSDETEHVRSEDLALSLCWIRVSRDSKGTSGTAVYPGRFGHTLTYLGSKSVAVIGGACFHSTASPPVDCQEAVEVWDVSLTRSIEVSAKASVSIRRIPIKGKEKNASSDLTVGGLRCHHQSLYDFDNHVLTVIGGGLSCAGLFGTEYSSLLATRVCCKSDCERLESMHHASTTEGRVKHTHRTATQKTALSKKPPSAIETLAILVPKNRLRNTKVYLETNKWLNKAVRIGPFCIDEGDAELVNLFQKANSQDVTSSAETFPSSLLPHKVEDISSVMAVPVTQEFREVLESGSARNGEILRTLYELLVAEVIPPVRNRGAEQKTNGPNPLISSPQNVEVGPNNDKNLSIIFVHQNLTRSKAAIASIPDGLVSYLKDLVPQILQNSNVEGGVVSEELCERLLSDIPKKFEVVGDVLMIGENCLRLDYWLHYFPATTRESTVWEGLLQRYNNHGDAKPGTRSRIVTRVARKAEVDSGPKRESRVRLLHSSRTALDSSSAGPDGEGWTEVIENGINYGFDITRVMFCSGNVTERMRMARFTGQRKGETIVDLFAGVGYYTLPFLVYAGAQMVHACEWNPNSVTALIENLRKAGVPTVLFSSMEECRRNKDMALLADGEDRKCAVYLGDNNMYASRGSVISNVADRICLGLLPSSVGGWELAVNALKPSGGVLHVHENVKEDSISLWVDACCKTFEDLFEKYYAADLESMGTVSVTCDHIERVKSFAPRVIHIVADLTVSWNAP